MGARRPASLMTSASSSIVSNVGSPDLALDQPGDVPVDHRLPDPRRDRLDELLPSRIRAMFSSSKMF
jgi:hypothetical protein